MLLDVDDADEVPFTGDRVGLPHALDLGQVSADRKVKDDPWRLPHAGELFPELIDAESVRRARQPDLGERIGRLVVELDDLLNESTVT